MIAGAAAIHLNFPEYRGLGQGYFTNDARRLIGFLEEQGVDPLSLLVSARQMMVLAVTLTLLAGYYFGRRLLGELPAFLGILMVALDPYHVGHSRLLTHDGLMSALLLTTFLSMMVYLYDGRERWVLSASGLVAGLALVTKVTALPIIPFVGLVVLLAARSGRKESEASRWAYFWRRFGAPLMVWAGVLAVVFFAIWPAMWVSPGETLSRVFGVALDVFGGQGAEVPQNPPWVNDLIEGFLNYGRSILGRTTPLVWLGVGLALAGIVLHKKLDLDPLIVRTSAFLFAFAVLFFTGLGAIADIQAPHYVLSAHVWLDMTAGLGLAGVLFWVQGRVTVKGFTWIYSVGLSVILTAQLVGVVQTSPYYFVYYNPVFGKQLAFGKGVQGLLDEGGYGGLLDEAGRYLAQKPDAEELTVMSWFGPASFSFFFPGTTEPLWPIDRWIAVDVNRLARSDYLVIYSSQFTYMVPAKLISELKEVSPEHVVEFNGIEYAFIYRVSDLPAGVFEPDSDFSRE